MNNRNNKNKIRAIDHLTPVLIGISLVLVGLGAAFQFASRPTALWIGCFSVGTALLLGLIVIRFRRILEFLISRRGQMGSSSIVTTLIFLGVLGLLTYLSDRHNIRIDWTQTGRHSLSQETIQILKNRIDRDVTVTAFYRQGSQEREKVLHLLETYEDHSHKVSVQFYDPSIDKVKALQYNVPNINSAVVIFESGEDEEKRKEEVFLGDEQDFTSALLKVVDTKPKPIYFVQGHQEHVYDGPDVEGYGLMKQLLEKRLYEVKELQLLQNIPKDCVVLAILGPRQALLKEEMETLKDYLGRGGKLLLMLGFTEKAPTFSGLLREFGLVIKGGFIVEPTNNIFGQAMDIVTFEFQPHAITDPFRKTGAPSARFWSARPMKRADVIPVGIQVTPIIESTPASWRERSLSTGTIQQDPDEEKGPFTLISTVGPANKDAKDKPRIVVCADSDFASNTYYSNMSNAALFLNCINWLAAEEDVISIPPRPTATDAILLTKPQQIFVFVWSIIAMPLLCLIAGTAIWWSRR